MSAEEAQLQQWRLVGKSPRSSSDAPSAAGTPRRLAREASARRLLSPRPLSRQLSVSSLASTATLPAPRSPPPSAAPPTRAPAPPQNSCPSCRWAADEADALQAALVDAEAALLSERERSAAADARIGAELGGAARRAAAQAAGLAAELGEAHASLAEAQRQLVEARAAASAQPTGAGEAPAPAWLAAEAAEEAHPLAHVPLGVQAAGAVAALLLAFAVGRSSGRRAGAEKR